MYDVKYYSDMTVSNVTVILFCYNYKWRFPFKFEKNIRYSFTNTSSFIVQLEFMLFDGVFQRRLNKTYCKQKLVKQKYFYTIFKHDYQYLLSQYVY